MIPAPPQIPTYAKGFARHQGESACPGLWAGLVGLWAPLLGPTGGMLLNWSSQGRAHDGTLVNMDPATDWVAGRYGWALDLPASSGYVNCASPSSLAISGRPNVSVLALVNLHSSPDYGGIWDNCVSPAAAGLRFSFGVYLSGQLRLVIGDGTAYSSFVSQTNVLTTGTWLQVGVTLGADNQIIFYCNGAPCGTATLNRDLAPSTAPWRIGVPYAWFDQGVDGLLAVLAVYDRVLAPGTIRQLWREPFAPLRLRRRTWGMMPAIGGPYQVAARQPFLTGAETGQLFHAGATAGELLST